MPGGFVVVFDHAVRHAGHAHALEDIDQGPVETGVRGVIEIVIVHLVHGRAFDEPGRRLSLALVLVEQAAAGEREPEHGLGEIESQAADVHRVAHEEIEPRVGGLGGFERFGVFAERGVELAGRRVVDAGGPIFAQASRLVHVVVVAEHDRARHERLAVHVPDPACAGPVAAEEAELGLVDLPAIGEHRLFGPCADGLLQRIIVIGGEDVVGLQAHQAEVIRGGGELSELLGDLGEKGGFGHAGVEGAAVQLLEVDRVGLVFAAHALGRAGGEPQIGQYVVPRLALGQAVEAVSDEQDGRVGFGDGCGYGGHGTTGIQLQKKSPPEAKVFSARKGGAESQAPRQGAKARSSEDENRTSNTKNTVPLNCGRLENSSDLVNHGWSFPNGENF